MSDTSTNRSMSSNDSACTRSRLPSVTSSAHRNAHNLLLSPTRRLQHTQDQGNEDNSDANYRDRSSDRNSDIPQRSELFRMHGDVSSSSPLKHTSRGHHDREVEVEQDSRGRSREEKSVDLHKVPTHSPSKQKNINKQREQPMLEIDGIKDYNNEEDDAMFSLMGFSGIGSTKGKSVVGSQGSAVRRVVSTDYRQYMNRNNLSPGRR